jgi:hypothetical protein
LTHVEVSIALKDLDRRILRSVKDVPVVDTASCDEAQGGLADPLPELDILVHCAGLELLLLLEVEDLKGPGLSLESNDLFVPVHDSTVGLDGPARYVVAILELNNDNFGLGGFVFLFPNANEGV